MKTRGWWLAAAAVTWCLQAGAATWMVGPTGAPASLADALAGAADGDTIELLSGDYRIEPLKLPKKRLVLRGIGRRPG